MSDEVEEVANKGSSLCECLGSTIAKVVGCACCIVVCVVVGVVSWFFATGQQQNIQSGDLNPNNIAGTVGDVVDNATDAIGDVLWPGDPWDYGNGGKGSGNGQIVFWYTSENRGLKLPIQNALSQDWYSYFDQAVQDWNTGTPDALDLSDISIVNDPECSHTNGVQKVCNGNYGDTGWKGLNEVLLTQENIIVASRAKMNEYYLDNSSSSALKQYTMCHELGHGFGLNHDDETFTNPNLGTCMDYTDDPEVNKTPNQGDYEQLREYYGTVPTNGEGELPQIYNIPSNANITISSVNVIGTTRDENEGSNGGGGGGERKTKLRRRKVKSLDGAGVLSEYNSYDISNNIPSFKMNDKRWKLLHKRQGKEVHKYNHTQCADSETDLYESCATIIVIAHVLLS